MPKTYRVVVIADQYPLEELIQGLVQAGVSPEDICVSRDMETKDLRQSGVRFSVPPGQIVATSFRKRPEGKVCGMCGRVHTYFTCLDNLVP